MRITQLLHHNLPHLANLLSPKRRIEQQRLLFQDLLILQYRAILLSQLWDQNEPWTIKELQGDFPTKKSWQSSQLWNNNKFEFLTKTIPISDYSISALFPIILPPNLTCFIAEFHQAHERILGDNLRQDSEGRWILESSIQSNRKHTGSFYTPRKLVEIIVEKLLESVDLKLKTLLLSEQEAYLLSLRFCDPSCGTGNFLIYLAESLGKRLFQIREHRTSLEICIREITQSCIYGADINWLSAALCQLGLWWKNQDSELSTHVRIGDALLGWMEPNAQFYWKTSFSEVFSSGGFDFVLGNPPYVDSETMKKQAPTLRKSYQKRFQSTKGNWDLYIPFSELGLKLLKPDGSVAFLTPKNILGSDYAKAIQEIWLQHQLLWIQDFSQQAWFEDAKISVVVVACQNKEPLPLQDILFLQYHPKFTNEINVKQELLRSLPSGYISFPLHTESLQQMRWLSLPRLASVVTCSDGASTKEAYEIRAILYEGKPEDRDNLEKVKLLNTGTIDPFLRLWGKKECRYLGFKGLHPVIDSETLKRSHPKRWHQAMSEKLMIAGLSSQIEAVIAPSSYLCGKTTTQIIPKDEVTICLNALACYLNSSVIFSFYRAIFAMRGFSHQAFLIGPRQIEQLPIPSVKYFTQWSEAEEITAQNQLSYWGQSFSNIVPARVDGFILDILRAD